MQHRLDSVFLYPTGRLDRRHSTHASSPPAGTHLYLHHLVEESLALLGRRDREHLDLAELVHAVQPLARHARRARLCAETVAECSEADGQLPLLHDLVHVKSAQRHFCSAGEAEVRVAHAVRLRVGHARLEAALLKNRVAHEVWRHHCRVAPRHALLHKRASPHLPVSTGPLFAQHAPPARCAARLPLGYACGGVVSGRV